MPGDTPVGEQGTLDPSSELRLLEEPNGIIPVFSDPEGVADGSELKRSLQRRREREGRQGVKGNMQFHLFLISLHIRIKLNGSQHILLSILLFSPS